MTDKSSKYLEYAIWLVCTLVTVTAFAFQTFETKDHAKEIKDDVVQRLDRIENKVDEVLKGMRPGG